MSTCAHCEIVRVHIALFFQWMTEKDDIIELTDYLQPLIAKLHTVVKLFRCSSTKNDQTLKKYTVDEFDKAFSLILDSKSSLE
jgi:hypothetical protein